MMKPVGTITTHSVLNYGAVLQAYALSQYINSCGFGCEVIDYQPPYVNNSYRLVKSPKCVSDLGLAAYQLLHYGERKQRRDRFADFRNDYLSVSIEKVTNHEQLAELANQYKLVVCGSDQIWSPVLHEFDEAYFMSAKDIIVPHISYAASFGQDVIEDSVKPELKKRLSGFQAFSSREKTAQKLIKELTGRDSAMVLDPVFLLDTAEWAKLMKPALPDKPYGLMYFLSNPGQSPYALQSFCAEHDLEPVSIGFSPRDVKYHTKREYGFGPCEFLQAVKSADVILTNSFHMTAFAILFQKNFYTRINKGEKSRNDRLITLLESLGLQDRLYYDDEAKAVDFDKKIDFARVDERLKPQIEASKAYLNNQLMPLAR